MSWQSSAREPGCRSAWKRRFSVLAAAAGLLAACALLQSFWGAAEAQAQAQAPQPRPRANSAPAARAATVTTPAPRTAPQAKGPAVGPQPAPTNAQPAAPPTSRVAANVNGEQISREELSQECLRRYGNDVIEGLVNKQLIFAECQRQNIVITDQELDEEIKKVADKFNLPVAQWLAMLQKERHITSDHYKRDIIWPTIALRRLARDQIQVTPEELNRAFESELGPQVEVRVIVAEKREKAENLLAMVQAAPADFGKIAKDYSDDKGSASVRGMIPPIRRHVGDPEIEKIAFALKKGEISPIIETSGQFIIMKCERHAGATFLAAEYRAQAEKQLSERIRDQKMRQAGTDLFERLQKQAQIVNVLNDAQLRQQMPGVAATVNGQPLSMAQLADECLARNGVEVLTGEIHRRLLQQELRRRRLNVTDAEIDAEIVRAAESYGYLKPDMKTPDVEAWLKAVTEQPGASVELYVRDAVWPSVALKKLVEGNIQVSDDDMQKGFEANFGERVEVLAIVLPEQRQAQKVWDLARNNPTEEFFGELARQYSIEPHSKNNAGAVPPIAKHSGQPLVEREAFKLQPGELSGIIATEGRFIILRCLGRTKPVVEDFAVVKDQLQKDIFEKKLRLAMAEEFDRLKEAAQIDNFLTGESQLAKRPAPIGPVAPASATKPVKR